MKEEDRRRLSDMMAHGESKQAIVAFFKVMGYSEQEVLSELQDAEPGVHIDSQPTEKKLPVFRVKTGKKPRVERLVAVILLVCMLAFVAYYAMPFLPEQETEVAPTRWQAQVVESSCSAAEATLILQNVETLPLPPTAFWIKENNANCTPRIELDAVWSKATVKCVGNFKDNETYTVASNRTKNDWFTCHYQ